VTASLRREGWSVLPTAQDSPAMSLRAQYHRRLLVHCCGWMVALREISGESPQYICLPGHQVRGTENVATMRQLGFEGLHTGRDRGDIAMAHNRCHISGDRWEGLHGEGWDAEESSPQEFERMLLRLDAKQYTMLTIAAEDPTHLMIGGGNGKYVVYATFDNFDFWNLMRREPASGKVEIYIGGQDGDFSANQVVDLEQARSAGLVFLASVELDPTQEWKKQ
jgi:hypothetical protein